MLLVTLASSPREPSRQPSPTTNTKKVGRNHSITSISLSPKPAADTPVATSEAHTTTTTSMMAEETGRTDSPVRMNKVASPSPRTSGQPAMVRRASRSNKGQTAFKNTQGVVVLLKKLKTKFRPKNSPRQRKRNSAPLLTARPTISQPIAVEVVSVDDFARRQEQSKKPNVTEIADSSNSGRDSTSVPNTPEDGQPKMWGKIKNLKKRTTSNASGVWAVDAGANDPTNTSDKNSNASADHDPPSTSTSDENTRETPLRPSFSLNHRMSFKDRFRSKSASVESPLRQHHLAAADELENPTSLSGDKPGRVEYDRSFVPVHAAFDFETRDTEDNNRLSIMSKFNKQGVSDLALESPGAAEDGDGTNGLATPGPTMVRSHRPPPLNTSNLYKSTIPRVIGLPTIPASAASFAPTMSPVAKTISPTETTASTGSNPAYMTRLEIHPALRSPNNHHHQQYAIMTNQFSPTTTDEAQAERKQQPQLQASRATGKIDSDLADVASDYQIFLAAAAEEESSPGSSASPGRTPAWWLSNQPEGLHNIDSFLPPDAQSPQSRVSPTATSNNGDAGSRCIISPDALPPQNSPHDPQHHQHHREVLIEEEEDPPLHTCTPQELKQDAMVTPPPLPDGASKLKRGSLSTLGMGGVPSFPPSPFLPASVCGGPTPTFGRRGSSRAPSWVGIGGWKPHSTPRRISGVSLTAMGGRSPSAASQGSPISESPRKGSIATSSAGVGTGLLMGRPISDELEYGRGQDMVSSDSEIGDGRSRAGSDSLVATPSATSPVFNFSVKTPQPGFGRSESGPAGAVVDGEPTGTSPTVIKPPATFNTPLPMWGGQSPRYGYKAEVEGGKMVTIPKTNTTDDTAELGMGLGGSKSPVGGSLSRSGSLKKKLQGYMRPKSPEVEKDGMVHPARAEVLANAIRARYTDPNSG